MIITLIGMSGTGKSYWSKKLENEKGFIRFGCDDLIENKLKPELKNYGYEGINDVAKWMGQPYDEFYIQNSGKYLEFEKQVLIEIFEKIKNLKKNKIQKNIVIDTTGSVIYTGEKILDDLKKISNIIYLETPEKVKNEMYELYIRDPKPVIWGDSFYKKVNETNMESLKRCYMELLDFRIKKYNYLANIILDYYEIRNNSFSIEGLYEKFKY